MKKIMSLLSIVLVLVIFTSGCGPSYVAVRTRPEAPFYARPVPPAAGYIWVEGEWVRGGNGYVYRRGYWAAPRARYHAYRPGHWENRRHGWVWIGGRWY